MSRPLRSTATPASSGFPATTNRSASERRDRYSMPPVSAVGTLPLAARRTDPQARTAAFDARLLTFHAKAADQDHAASTPDTTWPATRAAAKLIPKTNPLLGFDVVSVGFDASTTTPAPSLNPDQTILERLPDPHLTRSSPAFSLDAHHDSLQLTQLQGGLAPAPAGLTPEGQQSSISRTAPHLKPLPTSASSAFVTHRFPDFCTGRRDRDPRPRRAGATSSRHPVPEVGGRDNDPYVRILDRPRAR
jgi:hypothetical protein